uniref:VP protein n=1 Tax=Mops bat parvovirus TaxID=3141925 RepID=A0AAU7DZS9_9VIRU
MGGSLIFVCSWCSCSGYDLTVVCEVNKVWLIMKRKYKKRIREYPIKLEAFPQKKENKELFEGIIDYEEYKKDTYIQWMKSKDKDTLEKERNSDKYKAYLKAQPTTSEDNDWIFENYQFDEWINNTSHFDKNNRNKRGINLALIPGYPHLGPGNNIKQYPKNEIDSIAWRHDIEYHYARTPIDIQLADRRFIQRMSMLKINKTDFMNQFAKWVGYIGISAKQWIENKLGVLYPIFTNREIKYLKNSINTLDYGNEISEEARIKFTTEFIQIMERLANTNYANKWIETNLTQNKFTRWLGKKITGTYHVGKANDQVAGEASAAFDRLFDNIFHPENQDKIFTHERYIIDSMRKYLEDILNYKINTYYNYINDSKYLETEMLKFVDEIDNLIKEYINANPLMYVGCEAPSDSARFNWFNVHIEKYFNDTINKYKLQVVERVQRARQAIYKLHDFDNIYQALQAFDENNKSHDNYVISEHTLELLNEVRDTCKLLSSRQSRAVQSECSNIEKYKDKLPEFEIFIKGNYEFKNLAR